MILFADNLPSRAAARSLTARIQRLRRPKALRRYPLLIMTDKEGVPLLMDFGIARSADSTSLTATGAVTALLASGRGDLRFDCLDLP